MGLFIAAVFIAMFGNAYQTSQEQAKQTEYDTLLSVIQSELELAYRAPVGYTRTFDIPLAINSQFYNLTFDQSELIIESTDREAVRFLPSYVLGSFAIDYDDPQAMLSSTHILRLERTSTNVYLTSCPECTPDYATCEAAEAAVTCASVDATLCCDYHLLCCIS